jgi:hypothetical protein
MSGNQNDSGDPQNSDLDQEKALKYSLFFVIIALIRGIFLNCHYRYITKNANVQYRLYVKYNKSFEFIRIKIQ